MKTVGLIGGVGPESTIEYYRFIIEAYRDRKQDDSYPSIIINSVDVNKYVGLATANRFDTFAAELVIGSSDLHARARTSLRWLRTHLISCSMNWRAARKFR
jgi:aspartate racemase